MQKDRSRFDYRPVVVILLLLVIVRVSYIYICHFPLAVLKPRDTNILLEVVKLIVPVLTWALSCYAVTTILDGGSLIRETLLSTVYCMLPYVIFTLPLGLLSHLMGLSELLLYRALIWVVWIWIGILAVMSIKIMNDYTMLKTIGICLITIVTVFLIWAAFLLTVTLTGQLIDFFTVLITEIRVFLR